ncbi:MAG TPA: ATP synthase subunit I [Thermodesulfovibrionia bacterium]|nr:ATP synthase subunit I [Thermodesulfovibrionia bacterium]
MTGTLIKAVSTKGFVLVTAVAGLSVLIDSKGLPLSILLGGLLGLVNFRTLARSVQGLTGMEKQGKRMAGSAIFRLSLFAGALALLYKYNLVNIPGFVFGLTLIVYLILFEGYFLMRKVQ